MGCEDVALGREVLLAEAVEPSLSVGIETEAEDQRRLVERWLYLTRIVLPGMAAAHRWPVRLDHCFMRIMLDNAVGDAWFRHVARPAIRHAPPAVLRRAVELTERVVAEPAHLPELNRRSLGWRGKAGV